MERNTVVSTRDGCMSFDASGGRVRLSLGAALVLLSETGALAQFGGVPESVTRSISGSRSDGSARGPSLSSDGRFVAFESEATDLVPGDTNNNTDVFVYDALAGLTTRVSSTWKGQEARGDSFCPQISADGRYVAFLSRAWNMYPGGANLGTQPQRVFLHDRQEGTTAWISEPIEQQVVSFWAECPSIAADGGRIAFSAFFRLDVPGWSSPSFRTVFLWDRAKANVAAVDSRWLEHRRWRGPTLSADGRVVVFTAKSPPGLHALVLATGQIDTISPGRSSPDRVSVSADGRFVAFADGYANGPGTYSGRDVYLHDRATGTTQQITEGRGFTGCGRDGSPLPCATIEAGRPWLSADGRFVAYGSTSTNLVGESTHRGGQVYLFDRITGRTRRVSVSPSGLAGDSCSYDPAISSDGSVVAYKSASPRFAPGDDHRAAHQMIRARWRCGESGTCREDSACPPTPRECAPARSSSFALRRRPPGGRSEDRLHWQWRGAPGAHAAAFPNPVEDARYHLCVYTGERPVVDVDVAVPTSGWQERERGYRLRTNGPAALSVWLRPAESGPQIRVRGGGPQLDLPYLPLLAPTGATVQLHESGSGDCWGAHFPAESIERNHAGSLSEAVERRGRFVAKTPRELSSTIPADPERRQRAVAVRAVGDEARPAAAGILASLR